MFCVSIVMGASGGRPICRGASTPNPNRCAGNPTLEDFSGASAPIPDGHSGNPTLECIRGASTPIPDRCSGNPTLCVNTLLDGTLPSPALEKQEVCKVSFQLEQKTCSGNRTLSVNTLLGGPLPSPALETQEVCKVSLQLEQKTCLSIPKPTGASNMLAGSRNNKCTQETTSTNSTGSKSRTPALLATVIRHNSTLAKAAWGAKQTRVCFAHS